MAWHHALACKVELKACADLESFSRGGPTLTCFFEGGEVPNSTKWPPHSARETPFKWRFAGGRCLPNIDCWLDVIFQGTRTSIAKNPYIFVIFQEGRVRTPCPFSGSAHGRAK